MDDSVDAILADHEAKRLRANLDARTLALVRADPAQALRLVVAALDRGLGRSTFLDMAVEFVPYDAMPRLAAAAVRAFLADPGADMPEEMIERIALQAAPALQPWLGLFVSGPSPCTRLPWRGASATDIPPLLDRIRPPADPDEGEWAFDRIVETRRLDWISAAVRVADPALVPDGGRAALLRAGLDGPDRRLFARTVFHIAYPPEFLEFVAGTKPGVLPPYPSWSLPTLPGSHRFGGLTGEHCSICRGGLHHILTLDPLPRGLGVSGLRRLELAACLSCVNGGMGQVFYRHGESGESVPLDRREETPDSTYPPLVETSVMLSPTPPRWHWQDWCGSNGRENLHRVGGYPTWIQSCDYPGCPVCGTLMQFLLQLDSDFPTSVGRGFAWGSGGIGYAFWCDACRVSAWFYQCT